MPCSSTVDRPSSSYAPAQRVHIRHRPKTRRLRTQAHIGRHIRQGIERSLRVREPHPVMMRLGFRDIYTSAKQQEALMWQFQVLATKSEGRLTTAFHASQPAFVPSSRAGMELLRYRIWNSDLGYLQGLGKGSGGD